MAPKKFELFKGRSREQADQPPGGSNTPTTPTYHSEHVNTLDSPVPSTSRGIVSQENNPVEIFPMPELGEDDEDYDEFSGTPSPRRGSFGDDFEDQQALYQLFQNELNQIQIYDEPEAMSDEEASTTYDAYSIQSDEPSVTESSKYCAVLKKPKKSKSKEQELKDQNMWQASNYEVMTNLLSRSGKMDEKIKWEAIATARGLCTLTDNCTCNDCKGSYFVGVSDGDAGLGAAPLFSTIHLGCCIQ